MFTSIRKYNVKRGSADELARRVRDGFIPLLRQMQGFRSYYLLDGGPDVLITISSFDSADEAFASNETAATIIQHPGGRGMLWSDFPLKLPVRAYSTRRDECQNTV